MFRATSSDGRATVYEAINGFYLRNEQTGDTIGLGDGVDLFGDLPVGTDDFYRRLALLTEELASELPDYFGGGDS